MSTVTFSVPSVSNKKALLNDVYGANLIPLIVNDFIVLPENLSLNSVELYGIKYFSGLLPFTSIIILLSFIAT